MRKILICLKIILLDFIVIFMVKNIDIDELIASKNPQLAQRLPSFVKKYLHKVLHISEINLFLAEHSEEQGLEFLQAVMELFDLTIDIVGQSNFLNKERPLFIANHPLGGLDGLALLYEVQKSYGPANLLVNDFLMAIDNLSESFVPVNKHGSNRDYTKIIDAAAEDDKPLIIFPAGVCSRKLSYGVFDLEWRKTFVRLARQYNRTIIPIYITGRNSNFFYNFALLRKRLHIHANLEMLYLVNEMFKQKHTALTCIAGDTIASAALSKEYDDWMWARIIRQYVFSLKSNPDSKFIPETDKLLPFTYYG